MERISNGAILPERFRGGVAALGNFDGFHAGHQAVVGRALALAREREVPALVVSFDPHPARLFQPQLPPFALTLVTQRLDLLAAFGVDAAVMIPFTRELAGLPAETFVEQWLVRRLGLSGVVTGGDFTFGEGRQGNIEQLAAMGAQLGFSAEVVAPVTDAGGVISSTRVRAARICRSPRSPATLRWPTMRSRSRPRFGKWQMRWPHAAP